MVNSEFSVVGRQILADPCVVHTLKHMRTASENSLQNQDGTLIFQCASGGPWSTGLLTLAYGSGSVENVDHHIPSKRTCAQLGPWLLASRPSARGFERGGAPLPPAAVPTLRRGLRLPLEERHGAAHRGSTSRRSEGSLRILGSPELFFAHGPSGSENAENHKLASL